jgi:cell division protein FtsI (penicillin-binding protein 3)
VKRPSRTSLIHASFVAFALAILGRAGYVQLWQMSEWRAQAVRQHETTQPLPAPRGTILDAAGTVLVESRPMVEIAVAPREIRASDRDLIARELARVGVAEGTVRRAMDTARVWVPIPGRFLSSQLSAILSRSGVHATPTLERVPSPLTGLRGLIGYADNDGAGIDGVELALDSLLRGTPGKAAAVRDGRGRRLLSPQLERRDPVSGNTVVLTLRLDLQDIAERALSDAVDRTSARGGDVVVYDPRSGDVLALASRRSDPRATAATALTEPVEPGSTLKPFIAAALLDRGRVSLDDVFETYNGSYKLFGFTLTDVHRAPRMTFAQVIEYSSNIGIAQAAQRLTPREQYEVLRDFGFGAPTGLPFPSEASGVLRDPSRWSLPTQTAMARGYEIMVTPIQLAVAYGALANGGELLQPALVREVRDPGGNVVYRRERTVVRRVISPRVSAQMRSVLRSVVDSGSATRADLATFDVGGKSGTARRTERGRYVAGDYTATFVGLFPADDPQLVVLVKLDSPGGSEYYGGQIAAPVTKVVLEAALASRDAVLDRARLRQRARPAVAANMVSTVREAAAGDVGSDGAIPFVFLLPDVRDDQPVVAGPRPVPDVRGLPMRAAAAALHHAGFRVRAVMGGVRGETSPSAGTMARGGTLVQLRIGT